MSRFLDHSPLAVTSIYLRRLESEDDKSRGRVAAAIGVSQWRPARYSELFFNPPL